VKLPVDDPRAYVLGHMTNCCQSIGGHSEACVIDGVTRENNGFYVLLKAKRASEKKLSPLDENGKINYIHFDIVGQGYAWITEQHNLTFDSWENLTPKQDDEIIIIFLKKFAQQITHAKDSTFLRVTIGRGGKHRGSFVKNETSLHGTYIRRKTYGDSYRQGEIYCNAEKEESPVCKIRKDDRSTNWN